MKSNFLSIGFLSLSMVLLGGTAIADQKILIAKFNSCPGTANVGPTGILFTNLYNPIRAQTMQDCPGSSDEFPNGYPLNGNWSEMDARIKFDFSNNTLSVGGVKCTIAWWTIDMFRLQDPSTCEVKVESTDNYVTASAYLLVHESSK